MSQLTYYFQRWAARRAPRAAQVILKHRTIYVFPGKQGAAFLLLAVLIWLLGTNYQNNLILSFSFFLISLMLVSVIHAFKNLLGLTFQPDAALYATVGDRAPFDIAISSQQGNVHQGLLLTVEDTEPVVVQLNAGQKLQVRLTIAARHRGWMKLPRIVVKSYYPLGLIRSWAYVELDHRVLVFPRPIASDKPPLGAGKGDEGVQVSHEPGDEFQGFQTYQPGAPLSQIAWKQFARGAGLHLKDYRALQSQQAWLDWFAINSDDTELRLAQLSYWVNYFSENNIEFGLLLPGKTIAMGGGEVHRLAALTALALYGWVDE